MKSGHDDISKLDIEAADMIWYDVLCIDIQPLLSI